MISKIKTINKFTLLLIVSGPVILSIILIIDRTGTMVTNENLNPYLRDILANAHCKNIVIAIIIVVTIKLKKGYAEKIKYAIIFKIMSKYPISNEIFCIVFKD